MQKAAEHLLGLTIGDGWKVTKKHDSTEYQFRTGGVYSCCYEVRRNENGKETIGFLKAIDYSNVSQVSDVDPAERMQDMLNAYQYEKKILTICLERGLNNVVRLVESGGFEVDAVPKYPKVEYLILEHADLGDVRKVMSTHAVDFEWKVRSIHQIAKALSQLHGIGVAHQDVKPSNVVNFNLSSTKLADLGSACSKNPIQESLPKHLDDRYSGSFEYSPPELLYGHLSGIFEERRFLCDLYLLGNMVIFYFANMSMNSLLKSKLDRNLWWERPEMYGKFEYVKPYLIDAFEKALIDFRDSIEDDEYRDDLETIVRYLCNPDPSRRGHAKNLNQRYNQYGLARFLTLLDRIAKKIKYKSSHGTNI